MHRRFAYGLFAVSVLAEMIAVRRGANMRETLPLSHLSGLHPSVYLVSSIFIIHLVSSITMSAQVPSVYLVSAITMTTQGTVRLPTVMTRVPSIYPS